jgi:predicted molibdopterin-dependent oxidoreductase YjgC
MREQEEVMRPAGQLVRVRPRLGPTIRLTLDGAPIEAILGESVLTAVLTQGRMLRRLEFGGAPRAGFCLMGTCQDCWVWIGRDRRVRACTTPVAEGMAVATSAADELTPDE